VVVAIDSFKGSLGSAAAGAAARAGVLDADPDAVVVVVPVADGGEGTVAAVLAARDGGLVPVAVTGPLGEPLRSSYALLTDGRGRTAVLEAAATVGLGLLPAVDATVPPRAGSSGLGVQLRHALAAADRVLLGLGGTASTDGGTGLLVALGARLLDRDGVPLPAAGNPLWRFGSLDPTSLPDLSAVEVLCDVTNPLLGPSGAAAVFGPQKGASPEQVAHLEERMRHWAGALAAAGRDVAGTPGAGAAGGLGAALLACGARLVPGFEVVARETGLVVALDGADLVLTGEGSVDAQTAMGKAPAGIARAARAAGAVVVALGGRVERPERPETGLFDAVLPVHREPRPLPDALDPAVTAAGLRATAAEVVHLVRAVRASAARRTDHSR
jgi:glycerate kinase